MDDGSDEPISLVIGSAGLAYDFGGSDTSQDLPGLSDALPADFAGALVEHPVGSGGATRKEPQLHRSASVRCVCLHGLIMLLG